MIVNLDYDDALAALQADLLAEDDVLRCQRDDCGSARLRWFCADDDDSDVLIVDCEDCVWRTEQRFNGINYQ